MTNNTRCDELLNQVIVVIDDVLDKSPKVLASVMQDLKQAKGKNIRARVVIATALALDVADEDIERVVNFGACIELVHLATLVHDDIIDDAPTRRGKPSVQSKYGKKVAVIAGDYLFTQCFNILSIKSTDRLNDFSKAVAVICAGEAYQLQQNMNFDLSKADYDKIIFGKTAALFGLATYGTACELGASVRVSERLARVGYYMGMVFQMIDDCIDYEGDVSVAQKEVAKDLQDGVITYPLIYTLGKKPELKKILKQNFDIHNVKFIVDEVRNNNGVQATKDRAEKYYNLAIKKIDKSVGLEKGSLLVEIMDKVYYREA